MRGVPAGQKARKPSRRPKQATQQLIQPAPGVRGRNRQAQQEAAGNPSDRRHIAQRSSQALPSHGIGWMLASKEMRAFQEPVASQDQLMARPRAKQRSIVADTKAQFA